VSTVSQHESIIVIVSHHGIAIPGILPMNIPGFGFPIVRLSDFMYFPVLYGS
jgi:hypothetical protein